MKVKSVSPVQLFATPWTAAHHTHPSLGIFPGKSAGVGCHCLLYVSLKPFPFSCSAVPLEEELTYRNCLKSTTRLLWDLALPLELAVISPEVCLGCLNCLNCLSCKLSCLDCFKSILLLWGGGGNEKLDTSYLKNLRVYPLQGFQLILFLQTIVLPCALF